jgi:hypothetical protein
MNQYFFKMKKEEKENILDQHKSIYDGYVTQYGQNVNNQPLYVQDFANDKNGITVSNKGNVTNYKNVGINEAMLDQIGDGPFDLKNGTVDFDYISDNGDEVNFLHDILPSPNEDEEEIIVSLGNDESDEDYSPEDYEIFSSMSTNDEETTPNDNFDEVEFSSFDELPYNEFFDSENIDDIESLENSINESLDMFKRFKKYN